jgi:hypothetical protein
MESALRALYFIRLLLNRGVDMTGLVSRGERRVTDAGLGVLLPLARVGRGLLRDFRELFLVA